MWESACPLDLGSYSFVKLAVAQSHSSLRAARVVARYTAAAALLLVDEVRMTGLKDEARAIKYGRLAIAFTSQHKGAS